MISSLSAASVNLGSCLICVLSAVLLGLMFSLTEYRVSCIGRGFAVTLGMLPVTACAIILMVNGSVGTGIAVAGAFSLVRFRSLPGKAEEMLALFESMTIGLACGAGAPLFALAFTLLVCVLTFLYHRFGSTVGLREAQHKILNITVPEDLQYYRMFDTILDKYTSSHSMERVKTTNLGSLVRISFDIVMKKEEEEQTMIDELRCLNGNLEISCALREAETGL